MCQVSSEGFGLENRLCLCACACDMQREAQSRRVKERKRETYADFAE